MKEIECPSCGEMIPDDSRFCDMCGVELLQCVSCGALGTGMFCAECGKPMIARKNSEPATEKKIETARRPEPEKTPEEETVKCIVPAEDVHTTGGARRKTLTLKARSGSFSLRPEDEAVIGRTEGPYKNELARLDLISRRHGKFVKRGRDWYIVDFGSTNGTLVNDVELEPDTPMKIKTGDVVDIGTYIFDVVEL